MGRDPKSEFLLDTKGHCFLCMDPVSPPLIKLVPENQPDPTSAYSVECLATFLKMDMRKVFQDKSLIPSQLLAKVRTSKLKTDLCEECQKLYGKFLRLQRRLEKIRLEVDSCINEIHQKLKTARHTDEREKVHEALGGESNSDDLLKLEIAEVLRAEAENQCAKMLSRLYPRIRMQNMTENDIETEIARHRSTSTKAAAWNKTASHGSSDSTNPDSHGMRMEIDIDKVKLEKHFPNLSPDTEENSDWNELHNYASCHSDDEDESELKYTEPTGCSSSTQTNAIQPARSFTKYCKSNKLKGKGIPPVIPPPEKIPGILGNPQGQYTINGAKGKFTCRQCPKTFHSYKGFELHYRSIHLQEKFRCGTCGKEYLFKQGYEFHYLSIHANFRYQCNQCHLSFTQPQTLRRHNKNAHLDCSGQHFIPKHPK